MSFDLKKYLKDRQELVDEYLRDLLRSEPDVPQPLRDAMSYSLLAPGKRLRPALVFMACQAAGGQDRQALPAAAAVEMIHTYSLIHDDLPAMDDDDLRRGMPTCHKKFGEALAILAGDALLTLAFQVLAQHYPPETATPCCLELARGSGAAGMVGGQVEDLAWERSLETGANPKDPLFPRSDQPHTLEALERIHLHKTGALFQASLMLGILVAQSGEVIEPYFAMFREFGRCFGLVFQITDDLIDVEGDTANTGKRTQKDAVRGKLTYPGLLGVEESRRRARELAERGLAAIREFGTWADPLRALMEFVLARDR